MRMAGFDDCRNNSRIQPDNRRRLQVAQDFSGPQSRRLGYTYLLYDYLCSAVYPEYTFGITGKTIVVSGMAMRIFWPGQLAARRMVGDYRFDRLGISGRKSGIFVRPEIPGTVISGYDILPYRRAVRHVWTVWRLWVAQQICSENRNIFIHCHPRRWRRNHVAALIRQPQSHVVHDGKVPYYVSPTLCVDYTIGWLGSKWRGGRGFVVRLNLPVPVRT